MEEGTEDARITPELYFLIAKFLSGGPLKETAKTLLKELQSVEVLPRRLDWLGNEHPQSYDDLAAQYSEMSWRRLGEVCAALVSRPAPARLSLLSDRVVAPPPKYSAYRRDHSLVRRVAHRELGAPGGRALVSPRLLSGLQLQRRTLGHLSAVYCLLFDCTGRYVVTGADDLLVKVWSARDGRLLATLRGAGAEITDICVSQDGALLAAGSVERAVRVWKLSNGAPAAVLLAHTGTITSVNWAPMSSGELRWLASTSTDGSVAFWTCSRSGQFLSQPVHYNERMRPGACHMITAAWSAGGAFLAAGSADHHVRVYQLEPGCSPKRVLETAAHSDAVDSLAWAHRGLRFVSGSKDGAAALWTLHATHWRHTPLPCDNGEKTADGKRLKVTMVQWDASDAYIVTAVSDCSIRVWCTRTCTQVRTLRGHTDEAYVLEAHPYLPAVFLSAGHDGQLLVWDAHTGETLASFDNRIEGQGSGAIFDAKWGSGTVVAASDSHGHLLLLGLGRGHRLFGELPTELFFHTDYRPLVRDALGGALDEQTETPPHLMPPPFLVDVEGAPHAPALQRTVPGRENLTLSQLIPQTGADETSHLDLMIDALRRRQDDGDGAHAPHSDDMPRSVWRGSGVRRTLGSWQRGEPLLAPHTCSHLIPPLSHEQRDAIEATSTELNKMELEWYSREMRRRPVMISTADGSQPRGPPRKRGVRKHRPQPRPVTMHRVEEEEPAEESSGSDTSDLSVRLSASDGRSSRLAYSSDSSDSSSSSSGSSKYSDWEAGDELAPPKRARRKPVATKRYSPGASTVKRSERVAAPARPSPGPSGSAGGSASGSAGGSGNSGPSAAASSPAPPPPTTNELPEVYRPGEWLTAVTPRKAPYYPQMGDHCVYFRLGHQRYFEAVSEKDVYKVNPRDKPWERTAINECEPVKVVGIKYDIKPPRVACLKMASLIGNKSFTVRYHDMPDVIDFLVPMQQYKAAVSRPWQKGDRFRCMIDDSWWSGSVLDKLSPPAPDAPAAPAPAAAPAGWVEGAGRHFLSLRVRWDNGEVERLSPWDLEPTDPTRTPSEPGGAVPVLPHELEAVLYKPERDEWPPDGDRAESCRTISEHISQVMSLSVAEPFVAPVDLQLYPTYALTVPYPVDLATIKARLDNLFYRRAAAVQFDARYLASNAELFNKVHSPIVRQARLLTDLLLYIISNWRDADVLRKYHELAANYQSTDEEDTVNGKPGKRPARHRPSWHGACARLLSTLTNSADAEPFRNPVPRDQCPDYNLVVTRPMDLGTVGKKLAADEYASPDEFAADVRLIFSNSRLYNTNKRSRIYSMTVRLSALFAALWSRVPQQRPRRTRRVRLPRRLDSPPPGSARRAPPPARVTRNNVPRDSDSWDSDAPLHTHKEHKGKGVGKKSKNVPPEPEPGPSSSHHFTHPAGHAADDDDDDENLPLRNGTHAPCRGASPSSASEYSNIEVLEEELFDEEVALTYEECSPKRSNRRETSDSEPAVRKRRKVPSSDSSGASYKPRREHKRRKHKTRTRESTLADRSTQTSSSSHDAPAPEARRYESDHSYRPRYSSDDDAPLTLIRLRQENGEQAGAGPSGARPTNHRKKARVRLRARRSPRRYNEDSEEDSIAAISKRMRGADPALLERRRAQINASSRHFASHTSDHNYYNGHGRPPSPTASRHRNDTGESGPLSISSRGRVRKLTAKARGLLRD